MKVSVLSTYFENVGDDLIREGILYQLAQSLGRVPKVGHVTKSNRLSYYFPLSRPTHFPFQRMPARYQRAVRTAWRLLGDSRLLRPFDKVTGCDLFVVGGTPIFYFVGDRSFLDNEQIYSENWPVEIFDRRLDRAGRPPLIALGVGSILEGDPEAVLARHPRARAFLDRFLRRATLVTVRDDKTEALLRAACPERALVLLRTSCPSIWACRNLGVTPGSEARNDKRVLVAYSQESAGWDLGDTYDNTVRRREQALTWTVEYFREHGYEITLVAHNDLDVKSQSGLAGIFGLPASRVVEARELLQLTNRSRMMVTWRVHGAMAALSTGCAALLFKTDSRYQMAEELGAHLLDDRQLTREQLTAGLDRLRQDAGKDSSQPIADFNRRLDSQLREISQRFQEALGAGQALR